MESTYTKANHLTDDEVNDIIFSHELSSTYEINMMILIADMEHMTFEEILAGY